jgi:hypothetical protein
MNSRPLMIHKQYLSQQVGATCWLNIIIMEGPNYSDRGKECTWIVSLITPHRLNIFLRCKMQNYTSEYALSDGIWVYIICVSICGARPIFLKKVKFTTAN